MNKKSATRDTVYEYVKRKYNTQPEYPWLRLPNYSVFRHEDNRKWYAIIMDVPKEKLGLEGKERVDILNVKIDDLLLRDMLIQQKGYMLGYHLSRGDWISILLDGTLPLDEVCAWIDISYGVTASKQKKKKLRPPKEWLVPANPKYYDVEHAFDSCDIIEWKQSSSIKKGDIIYMYVAAPVSAILYKCRAVETDIPYNYHDDNLSINKIMRIRLLKRYDAKQFTYDILKEEYGILAIRGPRSVPDSLRHALEE